MKNLSRAFLLSFVTLSLTTGPLPGAVAAARPAAEARPWLYRNSDVPIDRAWLFGTLPNGLRYAIRRNGVPPGQVSIRLRVDVGSLMERDDERGYAHFMEHLTMRGSRHVPDGESKRIWQRLGVSFGSDSNAQTTPTGTTYALDLPAASPEGLNESMKILAGMMEAPNIVAGSVNAERAVVLAEMREGTNLGSKIADESRALFFAGQPLAVHSPIGTAKALNAATPERMQAFADRWYRPENVVISVSGDVDPAAMKALLERYFAGWKVPGNATPLPSFGRPDPKAAPTRVVVQPGVPVQLSMAWLRPWRTKDDTIIYNQRKLADVIALQMINRRLEEAARSGKASFLQAGVNVDDISRSVDATMLSVTPVGSDWEKALADVRAIIEDARTTPVTKADIDREYAQFDTALAIAVENKDTEASSKQADDLASAVDIRETIVTPEAALEIFRGGRALMTPAYMLDATRRMFTGDAVRTMLILPQAEPNAEGRLAAALAAPVQPAKDVRLAASTVTMKDLPKLPPAGKVASRTPVGALEMEFVTFANGVKLTMMPSPVESGKVRVNVRFGHGQLDLSPTRSEPTWAAGYVLASNGIGKLGQREIDDLTNGRRLGFDFGIDDDAFELSATTRPADFRDQLRLFATKLAFPGWAPGPVERAKAGLLAAYDAAASSPNGVLGRELPRLLRNDDRRFRTPEKAEISALTPEAFRAFWEPVLASGPIEVQVFGDVKADEIVAAVAETFGALPPRKERPVAAASREIGFPAHNATPVVLRHRGDDDQAAAVIAWPTGVGFGNVREARELDVLAQIISDRLFEKLRSVDGATYSPSAQSDWPFAFERGEGYLMVASQLKPDGVDYFYKQVREIAADLATKPVSADELQRTLAPTRQLLSRASTGSAFWMNLMEGAPRDPRYLSAMKTLGSDTLAVTPEMLRDLAAKYLVEGKSYSVVVLPTAK